MTRRLVVVVPSISDKRAPWDQLIGRLKQEPGYREPDCQWMFHQHGARWYRRGSIRRMAEVAAASIHERWEADGGYDEIVLTGHSLGGLIVRQAYVLARGAESWSSHRPWADHVDRIVLFASLNRGIEVSFKRRWWLPLVAWLTRVLPFVRRWPLQDMLRGSDFITNLRITWIRELNKQDHPPLVWQYLGTEDALVKREDSSDIQEFPSGHQEDIANANHANLLRLDIATDQERRYRLISRAFTVPRDTTEVVPEIGVPEKTIVLLLHGIRASNTTWVRDLEGEIRASDPNADVVTASYGRFSARKFILPITRRKFLGWLEDVYTERLAKNPKATFHFVGHSNGTYLLGRSLKAIPAMRFDRVLLAGSVLPPTYDWRQRFDAGQVRSLRNDRAAGDIPVGVLCAGLRGLGQSDVGTGGVDGFPYYDDDAKTEIYYYPGGHSAALAAANLPRLAAYILKGDLAAPPGLVRSPSSGFSLLSRASARLFRLAALGVLAGIALLALYGPWSTALNLLIGIAGLLVVFGALDLA